jgi:hypothetical protein
MQVLQRPSELAAVTGQLKSWYGTCHPTNQELTQGLELRCGASIVKTFWQRLVERRRRNRAELDQIILELAQEEASKPLLQPFPKRP